MQNNFCRFNELVGFDLWIPDSGFPFLVSGFLVLGCPFIAGLRFLMLLHFQGIIGKGHACKPEAR